MRNEKKHKCFLTLVLMGLAGLSTTLPSGSAYAHHSTSKFDMSQQYSMKGTVKAWTWQNPHAWLYVEVRRRDGKVETWGMEATSPNVLIRTGWKMSDIKVGDKVTVICSPSKDGEFVGFLQSVTVADGRTLKGTPTPVAGQNLPSIVTNGNGPPGARIKVVNYN